MNKNDGKNWTSIEFINIMPGLVIYLLLFEHILSFALSSDPVYCEIIVAKWILYYN